MVNMSAPDKSAYRLQGKEPHIITLTLLSAFAAMGAILMTPALPEIAKYFNISIGLSQLTITSFLLGYAIGQLIYGPLANRFGRKPALFIGIALATLGSLFSILSSPVESFHLLIIGRFLEAIGASAGLVISFTIINDFYYPKQIRRIMASLMLAFAIMPGLGIAIGGGLVEYIDWQACFYFLLLYGLVLILPVVRLSETLVEIDHHALHYKHLFKKYLNMFRNKKLIGFSLCVGFSSACIYVFGAEGPFIGIQVVRVHGGVKGVALCRDVRKLYGACAGGACDWQ
jgi:DHA1 family bicyclomycin/chloramphenicol resistance-like MFS transporter